MSNDKNWESERDGCFVSSIQLAFKLKKNDWQLLTPNPCGTSRWDQWRLERSRPVAPVHWPCGAHAGCYAPTSEPQHRTQNMRMVREELPGHHRFFFLLLSIHQWYTKQNKNADHQDWVTLYRGNKKKRFSRSLQHRFKSKSCSWFSTLSKK